MSGIANRNEFVYKLESIFLMNNRRSQLKEYVGIYRKRNGFFLKNIVSPDLLYPENSKWLKDKNIRFLAIPIGRPSANAVANHVRPGERNRLEGNLFRPKRILDGPD